MDNLFMNMNLFRGDTKVEPCILQNKIIGLYFSAHWCPPCRQFTPKLKEFYESLNEEPFEIIFVTSDNSEESYMEYYNNEHGKWLRLEFDDPSQNELAQKYGVAGIPMLIIVNHSGKVISKNGRSDVMNHGNAAIKGWINAAH